MKKLLAYSSKIKFIDKSKAKKIKMQSDIKPMTNVLLSYFEQLLR